MKFRSWATTFFLSVFFFLSCSIVGLPVDEVILTGANYRNTWKETTSTCLLRPQWSTMKLSVRTLAISMFIFRYVSLPWIFMRSYSSIRLKYLMRTIHSKFYNSCYPLYQQAHLFQLMAIDFCLLFTVMWSQCQGFNELWTKNIFISCYRWCWNYWEVPCVFSCFPPALNISCDEFLIKLMFNLQLYLPLINCCLAFSSHPTWSLSTLFEKQTLCWSCTENITESWLFRVYSHHIIPFACFLFALRIAGWFHLLCCLPPRASKSCSLA